MKIYDLKYNAKAPDGIEKRKAYIIGDVTAKDLPKINPLKLKETEKTVLSLINGIEKYPSLYPGKNPPLYKK